MFYATFPFVSCGLVFTLFTVFVIVTLLIIGFTVCVHYICVP